METWVLLIWMSTRSPAVVIGYDKVGCEEAAKFVNEQSRHNGVCVPGPKK